MQLGCVLVTFPITLLKNLSSLRYTSFVSIISILFLAAGIITRSVQSNFGVDCIEGPGKCPGDYPGNTTSLSDLLTGNGSIPGVVYGNQTDAGSPVMFKFDRGCLVSFSIMACAFLCHFNVVPTQNDLRDPTRSRLNRTTQATMAIAYFLYVVIACFGYLEFREDACDNVLKNYDSTNALITLGRCCLALTLLLSFPLITHPARDSLMMLIFKGKKVDLAERSWFLYLSLTLGMATCFFLLGSSITSIVTVWSFLGSTVAIIVGYILPAVMYLKIREPTSETATFIGESRPGLSHSTSGNAIQNLDNIPDIPILQGTMHRQRLPATILLVAGILLMLACTTQAVLDVLDGGANSEPSQCH